MHPNFQISEGKSVYSFVQSIVSRADRGQQYQLLEWLKEITFPTEAAFADPEYAKAVYPGVINTTIEHGVRIVLYLWPHF